MDEPNRRMFYVWFEASKPYILLTLSELCLAIFMIMVQYVVSDSAVSPLVIVVYEHAIATLLLAILGFFLEKNKRPPLSFKILCYAFLLGGLHDLTTVIILSNFVYFKALRDDRNGQSGTNFRVTLCQLLLTVALDYTNSTFESIGINLVPVIVFVLALIFQQEKLKFWSLNGQAKILGIVISVGGALALVLWKGPVVLGSMSSNHISATQDKALIGSIMVIVGVLATSFWSILMGSVTKIYPAEISLTAMMNFFGTIQSAIVSAIVLTSSSWKPEWDGGLTLATIFMGGFVITGFFYYVMTWVIHKKGAVFNSAFNPLLVVFSFLLQTFVLGSSAHLGSIVGGVMVILGLYLILWAKAKESTDRKRINEVDPIYTPLIEP